jgi:hypothetical protein
MADPAPGYNQVSTMLTERLNQIEDRFGTHLAQVQRHFEDQIHEQARWIEGGVHESLQGLQLLWETVAVLTRRIEDLEGYLGWQDGAQAIVMYNGQSAERVHRIERGMFREESVEPGADAEATAAGVAWPVDVMEPMEEESGMVQERASTAQQVEEDLAVAVPVAAPSAAQHVEEDLAVAVPVAAPLAAPSTAQHVEEDVVGAIAPPINIIPATPQDSQEMPSQATLVAPPLPPLLTATSLPEQEAATPASRRSPRLQSPGPSHPQLSPSPRPTPPPAHLRRSPRGHTPDPSGLHSRSTTPQPNLKKRRGTSEDRGDAKRGRME